MQLVAEPLRWFKGFRNRAQEWWTLPRREFSAEPEVMERARLATASGWIREATPQRVSSQFRTRELAETNGEGGTTANMPG